MPSTRVAATYHPPSSVLASVTCSLSSRNLQHLVVGKLDRLEVYSVQPDRLELECTYQLTGTLRALKAIPISQHRCNILVLLDHPDPATLFLSYSGPSESGSAKLISIGREDLYERGIRPAEYFMNVVVHPNGKVAIVSCYTRRLKVILISEGAPESYNDIQFPEISNVLDISFLPIDLPSDTYTLTFLLEDHNLKFQLISRDLMAGSSGVDLLDASENLRPTAIPKGIIPCLNSDCLPRLVPLYPQKSDPKFLGGILVIGGRKIALYECEPKSETSVKGKRKRTLNEPEKHKSLDKKSGLQDRKPIALLEWPWSDVSAVTSIDHVCEKILIGDRFGRFSILSAANVKTEGLVLVPLGETSSPTSISYLDNQAVFIGSHHGDSQVIKIHTQPTSSEDKRTLEIPPHVRTVPKGALEKGKGRAVDEDVDDFSNGRVVSNRGTYLTVLQTFKNIAPILDAVLTNVDSGGQPQIVTCSGGANTGSVNVVRMGADFDELAAVIGLENVTGVWPIRSSYRSLSHSHIVVSTLDETHIFRIDSGETLSRIEAVNSFALEEATICVQNVAQRGKTGYQDSFMVVQVTETAVHLLEYDPSSDQWWERDTLKDESSTNVAASINPSQVLIARNGGKLIGYTLEVQGLSKKFKPVLQSQLDYYDGNPKEEDNPNHVRRHEWRLSDISAVTVNPMNEAAFFTNHVAVAFWQTNQVKIYAYKDTGFTFVSQSPPLPAPVRSLLFYNFGSDVSSTGQDHHPCLIAGLTNGLVVSFSCVGKGKELKDMKVISLGDSPISLSPCQIDGRRTVLACGAKSAILAWDRSRLQHSPMLLKDINSVHPLNAPSYPDSIVLGTSSGLHIGRVQNIHKMHVRGISLGLQTPRKIVHHPVLKVFGVVVERNEPVRAGDDDRLSSKFIILDDTAFEDLGKFDCNPDEVGLSLTTMTCTFSDPDETRSFFCLGTMFMNPSDLEPREGRIIILSADSSSSSSNLLLTDEAAVRVYGGVYSMGVINGLLAAAVNSSVILYRLEKDLLGLRLQKLAEWNHTYVMTNIVISSDHLVVADYLQSVSLLKLVDNSKFVTVARDYSPLMPIAVGAFDERRVIGADHNLNLFSFSLQQEGNRRILKRDGHYHLGEVVSKFLRGSIIATNTEKRMEPTHIFCTNTGRISVIVDVSDTNLGADLTLLEIGLTQLNTEEGQESHAKYRAPRMSRGRSDADEPSYGFIDGDFLEQLLPLLEDTPNSEKVRKIFAVSVESSKIRSSRDQIYEALENIRNMH
ncbi:hypothetical protein L218DRAFT_895037 [Marasmius fiardii PR-910]|nr:hypothetical protein L218DRAFT_895037 [Marasmius fiardii PR-910]